MRPLLESARLSLRRYEPGDFDFFAALCADPDVMRYIGPGVTLDRSAAAERFERWLAATAADRGFFLAVTKADARPIGHAALVVQDIEGSARLEIGWWLARSAWGCGYATEAAAALRDFAFAGDCAGVVHIIAPENLRSIAVARRIGSRFERAATFGGRPVHLYGQQAAFAQPAATARALNGMVD